MQSVSLRYTEQSEMVLPPNVPENTTVTEMTFFPKCLTLNAYYSLPLLPWSWIINASGCFKWCIICRLMFKLKIRHFPTFDGNWLRFSPIHTV